MSPDAPGRAAFATLGAWYADRRKYPDVTRLVADLAGRDAARSGQRLAALIRQAGADRRLGRKRAPIWGGPGDIDALLVQLARELAGKASGESALPVVEALLAEPLVEGEAAALAILRRSPTPAADAILAEIVATPATRSHAALVEAIEQAHARGLASPAIARLVDHPHPGVRASARSASGRAGEAATGRLDAAASVRTWTGPALERAAARVWPPPPPGAVWTRVTVHADGAGGGTATTHVGWLLGQDETSLRILSWHGTVERVERSRAVRSDGDLRDATDELLRIRALPAAQRVEHLSRRGAASAQFEAEALALPEVLVAAWSLAAGDDAGAARLILPRVAELAALRQLDVVARDAIGHALHEQMLAAFQSSRDDEALALAEHLGRELFDGFTDQEWARELAAQLRARTDEPVATRAAWDAFRVGASRVERAQFLAARLRQMTARQWQQPGGVSYWQATVPAQQLPTIQPFAELMRLRLTADELLCLVPWLADASYMRIVGYWREFAPERELHRSSWALAVVLNEALGVDVVDASRFAELDEPGRTAELARIAAVIAEHRR